MGYDVTPASNDKSKAFNGQSFSFMSISKFPELPTDKDTQNTIELIDVLWFKKGTNKIIGAFEVEKSKVFIQVFYVYPTCILVFPMAKRYFISSFRTVAKKM